MKAFDIFDVPTLEFIEPSFELLPQEEYTALLLSAPAEETRLAVDEEEEWPVALAVRAADGWMATSFLLRPPTMEVVEFVESMDGGIVRTTQEEWMRACREYFSIDIIKKVSPAIEDFSPERAAHVKDLLGEVWGDRAGSMCLDCGCGSGMGSAALREIGLVPLSYDKDAALLSLGLSKGRLVPESTICIDGGLATLYVRPAPLGLALMAGTINDFTSIVWKQVLGELIELTDEALITVETEQEAELVRMWALGKGKKARLFENPRDLFFDRWACLVTE